MAGFYKLIGTIMSIVFWCLVILTICAVWHNAGGNLSDVSRIIPQITADASRLISLLH